MDTILPVAIDRTAVAGVPGIEIRFPATNGTFAHLEQSNHLKIWLEAEVPIEGSGQSVRREFVTESPPARRFFRVIRGGAP